MKFTAIIFDMDGLMLDTERIYREVFTRAAADCQIEFPSAIHDRLLGRNTADMKRILRELLQDDVLFEQFLDRNRHHHAICFAEPPPIKQGLLRLLELIESRRVPKVVATSTPRKVAIARLESCGLLRRFSSVNCGDEVSRGKPAPDLFLMAAATLAADPAQCLVLEDSEAGVAGAHAAGMTAWMVPDIKQPTPDIRQLAHGVYDSLLHVYDFLQDRL